MKYENIAFYYQNGISIIIKKKKQDVFKIYHLSFVMQLVINFHFFLIREQLKQHLI